VAIKDIRSVHGFHGTSEANAESILRNGFRPSENPYDWLGAGVYFFQDAPHAAHNYAEKYCQENGGEPTVLRSRVRLASCIDLFDTALNDTFRAIYETCSQANESLPENNGGFRPLDRMIVNYVCSFFEEEHHLPVQSVRGIFIEHDDEERLFPGSLIYKTSHVQIAVRDTALIEHIEPWEQTGSLLEER
jgi:hypothetical protein